MTLIWRSVIATIFEMMNYTVLWALWILAFVVIEGAALTNRIDGDTLSAHLTRWFSVRDKGRAYRARRIALLAFLSWLLVHLLSGGAYAQTAASGTCAWTQDAIDPRQYHFSECPIAGVLVVYTHKGVNGAGEAIPEHEQHFTAGMLAPGDRVGLWYPHDPP